MHKQRAAILAAVLGLIAGLWGCPPAPPPRPNPTPGTAPATRAATTLPLVRRQVAYIPIDPAWTTGATRITLGRPTAENQTGTGWPLASFSLFVQRGRTSELAHPLVEQLLGEPRIAAQWDTFLEALPEAEPGTFNVTSAGPIFLRVEAPATLEPLTWSLPLNIATPTSQATNTLTFDVADITLLTDPRIFGIATTTADQLSQLLPDAFGAINGIYLDRGDETHAAAIAAFDRLMRFARREGLVLVVEDLAPAVRVDDVGRVSLDWEAYDRTMGPYLDGSAFSDRIAQPVWVAPLPPRRIRESPTQLRQYLQQCIEHHTLKGWVGVPAILHTGLLTAGDDEASRAANNQLRDTIARTVKLHVGREVLVISTPDVDLPHKPMWVLDEADTRFPPPWTMLAGYGLRAWPWMCAARGVQGMVWRNALAGDERLLMVQKGAGEDLAVHPTPRLAQLIDGLQDVNLVGLLEKRGDPTLAREIMAGVAGRTGTALTQPANSSVPLPVGGMGFLYAGWPSDQASWAALPGMLQRFVLANEPGRENKLPADDPLLLAARLWVARAHRPAARVSGFDFSVTPGRDGAVLAVTPHVAIENPTGFAMPARVKLNDLPGDFVLDEKAPAEVTISPFGAAVLTLPLAGRLDSILAEPGAMPLSISERINGSQADLPLQTPVHRTRATNNAIKLDGRNDDWPLDMRAVRYGPMRVARRFANRPDLQNARVHEVDTPATAQWCYDATHVYAYIRVPQKKLKEERNNEWPLANSRSGVQRWFGSDGVQLLISGGVATGGRTIIIGIKPSGVGLTRTITLPPNAPGKIEDGPQGLRYAVTTDAEGYSVEVALPRKWFATEHDREPNIPVWRVNIITHRHDTLTSASWSGPLVSDADLGIMGLLIGGD